MSFITTFTGKLVYPLDLTPEQICIEDIAHALSLQTRFTGHCRCPYSIAEHSIYVSLKCDGEYALQGLLHDATEAYFADLARPVKQQIIHIIKPIEDKIWKAIAEKYNVPVEMHESIHIADRRILYTEALALMNPIGLAKWEWKAKPYDDIVIQCYSWREAEVKFLQRFEELIAL